MTSHRSEGGGVCCGRWCGIGRIVDCHYQYDVLKDISFTSLIAYGSPPPSRVIKLESSLLIVETRTKSSKSKSLHNIDYVHQMYLYSLTMISLTL